MLNVSPADLVHVGDHYEFDYLVPRAVGIQAFYLDRSARREGGIYPSGFEGAGRGFHPKNF